MSFETTTLILITERSWEWLRRLVNRPTCYHPGRREKALIKDVKKEFSDRLEWWQHGSHHRGLLIRNQRVRDQEWQAGLCSTRSDVSGNALELFNRLAEVGSDPWNYSFNGYYVPTLVFDDVSFSGA